MLGAGSTKTENDVIGDLFRYLGINTHLVDRLTHRDVYNSREKFYREIVDFLVQPLDLYFSRKELIKYFIDVTGTDATDEFEVVMDKVMDRTLRMLTIGDELLQLVMSVGVYAALLYVFSTFRGDLAKPGFWERLLTFGCLGVLSRAMTRLRRRRRTSETRELQGALLDSRSVADREMTLTITASGTPGDQARDVHNEPERDDDVVVEEARVRNLVNRRDESVNTESNPAHENIIVLEDIGKRYPGMNRDAVRGISWA